MELHEDEEDAVSIGLHRSFAQDTAVLESVVTTIVQGKGDADPAIFKQAQCIVSALGLNLITPSLASNEIFSLPIE